MNKKVLIMTSGGIDSVGVAYIVLTDPKYKNFQVHLHHLNLINIENRNEVEYTATSKIIRWFLDKGLNLTILLVRMTILL